MVQHTVWSSLACACVLGLTLGGPPRAWAQSGPSQVNHIIHEWIGSHVECNVQDPNACLASSPNDGFVRVNEATHPPNSHATMSFYNEDDLAFYYVRAETFAINDRYLSSVLGPTFPNRAYVMAAITFGHLTSEETLANPARPLGAVYQPITGTIFDWLEDAQVSWLNYFSDVPQSASFHRPMANPHVQPLPAFFAAARAGTLPAVAWVDANCGLEA